MSHDPRDSGPVIMGVTWAFTALSMIVIALRFYVRTKIAQDLKAHDWIMLIALVCFSSGQTCVTMWEDELLMAIHRRSKLPVRHV